MTANERIARWLGWKWRGGRIRRDLYPAQGFKRLLFDPRPFDQSLHYCDAWQPDVDITLWHGKGGLLEEIEERGLWSVFCSKLSIIRTKHGMNYPGQNALTIFKAALFATPAQLSAALDAVLKEAGDGS